MEDSWLTPLVVDGVYRAGFASAQEAYETAVKEVFKALDRAKKLLEGKEYIVGNRLTECDVRLWVIAVRSSLFVPPYPY
jgi:glutathionyl-hydroquinone reductase